MFKTLEQRYREQVRTLYGDTDFTAPTLPNTRTVPLRSTLDNFEEMTKFVTTPSGLLYVLNQQLLQTGNAFSETRLINPLSIIGSPVPFTRFIRPSNFQANYELEGDPSSPLRQNRTVTGGIASFARNLARNSLNSLGIIGQVARSVVPVVPPSKQTKAGRLQIETSNEARLRAMGTSNTLGILTQLGQQALSPILSTIGAVRPNTLDVNERPELNIRDGLDWFEWSVNSFNTRAGQDFRHAYIQTNPYWQINDPNAQNTSNTITVDGEAQLSDDTDPLLDKYERNLENVQGSLDSTINAYRTSITAFRESIGRSYSNLGFVGGFVPDKTAPQLQEVAQTADTALRPYFVGQTTIQSTGSYHDRLNLWNPTLTSGSQPNADVTDLVEFRIRSLAPVISQQASTAYDLRFRAYISSYNETLTPEITSIPYIGRIEKNIVYSNVTRQISVGFMVVVNSPIEMEPVWNQLNYLVGTTYPAAYDSTNGFMIPPIQRLTVGNLHRNRVGYISGLTLTVPDGTPWEITNGYQLPMMLEVSMEFVVIDPSLIQSNTPKFAVGNREIGA